MADMSNLSKINDELNALPWEPSLTAPQTYWIVEWKFSSQNDIWKPVEHVPFATREAAEAYHRRSKGFDYRITQYVPAASPEPPTGEK